MSNNDGGQTGKLESQESTEAPAAESSEVSEGGGESSEQAEGKPAKAKINILLKPVGDAPIMKKKKWAVDPDKKIFNIVEFIRKYLHLDSSLSLFLYVNQAFAPTPDQVMSNLYECFGSDDKLVLHYCTTQAWG